MVFGKKRQRRNGATMPEAAIAVPMFLFMIFGVVDICRYYLCFIVMDYAAYRAVDFAAKQELETPIDAAACEASPDDCLRYRQRIQEILDRAVSSASVAVGSSQGTSTVRLVRFEQYKQDMYNDPNLWDDFQPITADAAFLRPGEYANRVAENRVYIHPFRNPFIPGLSPGLGWPKPDETWSGVLLTNPVAVHLEAEMRTFTPLLGTWRIRVTEYAFRRKRAFGVMGQPSDPILDPEPDSNPVDGNDDNNDQHDNNDGNNDDNNHDNNDDNNNNDNNDNNDDNNNNDNNDNNDGNNDDNNNDDGDDDGCPYNPCASDPCACDPPTSDLCGRCGSGCQRCSQG